MTERHFAFGKNWSNYVEHALDEERVAIAVSALQQSLALENLRGRTFLDIGSGSGLHSLAAFLLEAEQIVSFDYDAESVQTTERLRTEAGSPAHWQVLQGSILDEQLVAQHRASIVYSWGVLHHTGAMWQAIRNAARMAQPGGLFCIAIYQTEASTPRWKKIKSTYVRSPGWVQGLMLYSYEAYALFRHALRGEMPWRVLGEYKARGMNWHHDMIDWIGGYPFETATAAELRALCEGELGMSLVRHAPPAVQGGLNELLFKVPGVGCAEHLHDS